MEGLLGARGPTVSVIRLSSGLSSRFPAIRGSGGVGSGCSLGEAKVASGYEIPT
jgi:hypothetical protein